jgi:hypothetical protein
MEGGTRGVRHPLLQEVIGRHQRVEVPIEIGGGGTGSIGLELVEAGADLLPPLLCDEEQAALELQGRQPRAPGYGDGEEEPAHTQLATLPRGR